MFWMPPKCFMYVHFISCAQGVYVNSNIALVSLLRNNSIFQPAGISFELRQSSQ